MIRAMLRRWRSRRSLPAIMRHGTPRDGGRGTLNAEDMLYASGGHLERTAAQGSGLLVTRPESATPLEWRAMQAAQRLRETPEAAMQRRNALGSQANYWNR